MLARRQGLVVRLQPVVCVFDSDAVVLAAQGRAVHVLNRLVHKLSEERRAHANGGEAQLAEKLILHRAPLVQQYVRRERVDGLEVALLHMVEGELLERERRGVARRQLVIGLLERLSYLPRPLAMRQHEQVLGSREGRVVEAPEVEVLDGLDGLVGLARAVAVLDFLKRLVAGLRGRRIERVHHDDGKLHPLRLVNGQKRHAPARDVLGLVLVLVYPTCHEESQVGVEEPLQRLVDSLGGEDVDVLQVLELARYPDEGREVAHGPLVVHARVERRVDDGLERLEFEELVDQSRERVVGVSAHRGMGPSHGCDPPAKGGVALVLQQLVRPQDARYVVTRALLVDVLEIARLDSADVRREQQKQDADGQPHLVAVEERVRSRRVDADAAFLEPLGEVAGVSVLDRLE